MKYFCKNFWQTSFHLNRKHYLCTPNYDVTKEFDVLLTHSKKNKRTFGVPAEWTNAGSYFFFLLCHLFPEYLRFPIFSNTRNCFSASPGVFSYIRE